MPDGELGQAGESQRAEWGVDQAGAPDIGTALEAGRGEEVLDVEDVGSVYLVQLLHQLDVHAAHQGDLTQGILAVGQPGRRNERWNEGVHEDRG
jgi:hypothetical protein